jgi:outer membrane putative beta-barrel porin/alpha-amylase
MTHHDLQPPFLKETESVLFKSYKPKVFQQNRSKAAVPGRSGAMASLARLAALATALVCVGAFSASADTRCSSDTIVTDRPDVTNSSIVVPAGSLQSENGIDLTARESARIVDGTASRLRLGIATCVELLVDLPSYFISARGRSSAGFSNLVPAVKWQLGPLPGQIDLSLTAGVGLPTGTTRLTGRGTQPYVQMPWSRDLGGGWGVSGMLTAFFFPETSRNSVTTEPTFVIEKEIGARSDLFIEYVGEYPSHGSPSQLLNSGGAYRITPKQQIDFHIATGLNRAAPSYVIGVGYSFRFDGLF